MLNILIDRVGEWNPQIFRELKERLNIKNIGIAIVGSVVIQGFIWFYYYKLLPVSDLKHPTYSRYCFVRSENSSLLKSYHPYPGSCIVDKIDVGDWSYGNVHINWQPWWLDVFTGLSWSLALGLILGSVYLLVADLVQEEKRGTLNFIRLSPQSARTIFIGKILGVPSLVYLAVALMVPFHLFAGINAGGGILLLTTWYLTVGAMWWLLASAASLYVLLGGIQAILTVIAVAWPVSLMMMMINTFASATINRDQWMIGTLDLLWFGLPVMGRASWVYTFISASCLVASYWVWQALDRRYLNPTATVISKHQGYLVNLFFQLWMVGFAIPKPISISHYGYNSWIVMLAIFSYIGVFLLIPLLLPSKQALQDWTRYRRERFNQQGQKFWQRDLWRDLISNDRSPVLLSIAINMGMVLVLWIPIAFLNPYSIRFMAGLCLATSLILIYATIAQLSLFLKLNKLKLWMVAIVIGSMLLPIVVAVILSPVHTPTGLAAIFLLFSPMAPLGILNLAGGTILATFGAQLALLAGLIYQLQRKLQITGQSQSKQLLTGSKN